MFIYLYLFLFYLLPISQIICEIIPVTCNKCSSSKHDTVSLLLYMAFPVRNPRESIKVFFGGDIYLAELNVLQLELAH